MASSDISNDKKRTKKSGETASRSKDKEHKSKHNDRTSTTKRDKTSTDAVPDAAVSSPTAPPLAAHDPDAIQLFRRYDRSRSGVLTRFDFLQLLKDYANPNPPGSTCVASPSRPPLSLTDSRGTPLGYQRAVKNSEFEAGQLFERYDRDRTGALTLDAFHRFFAHFNPQLRAFVEESNYRPFVLPVTAISHAPLQPVQEDACLSVSENVQDTANSRHSPLCSKGIRLKYRAALWKLRNLCKDDLFDQRERLVQHMKALRVESMHRQQHSRRRSTKRRPSAAIPVLDFDDEEAAVGNAPEIMTAKQYEAMEDDLDRLDELTGYVRCHVNKGRNVSQREMQKFLDQADRIEEEAECLAMKDYGEILKSEANRSSLPFHAASFTPALTAQDQKRTDLESFLRVKDQMIFQLLQERTAMRKEHSAIEASLKKLGDVSTREMKNWAQLTDEMQAEIQQLQAQLRSARM